MDLIFASSSEKAQHPYLACGTSRLWTFAGSMPPIEPSMDCCRRIFCLQLIAQEIGKHYIGISVLWREGALL
jgi:hypothetical protein